MNVFKVPGAWNEWNFWAHPYCPLTVSVLKACSSYDAVYWTLS